MPNEVEFELWKIWGGRMAQFLYPPGGNANMLEYTGASSGMCWSLRQMSLPAHSRNVLDASTLAMHRHWWRAECGWQSGRNRGFGLSQWQRRSPRF
jgi:hypothetical protein